MHSLDPAFAAPPVAVACVPDQRQRASLERVLSGVAVVRHTNRAAALLLHAADIEIGALMYGITGRESRDDLGLLESAHRRFPHLPLLLVSSPGESAARTLELGGLVVMGAVAPSGTDDLAHVVDLVLDEAIARSAAGRLLATASRVRPELDPLVRRFVAHTATVPRDASSVGGVARRLGVSRRTLEKHLRRQGLPSAHVLYWTIMIVRGAVLLQDPRSTLQRLARLLPFPDPAAVSTRFRRYVGVPPTSVRHPGALDRLVASFATLLASGRPVAHGGDHQS